MTPNVKKPDKGLRVITVIQSINMRVLESSQSPKYDVL